MYVIQSGISKQFKPRYYKLHINTHEDVTDIDRADSSGQYIQEGPGFLSPTHSHTFQAALSILGQKRRLTSRSLSMCGG